MGSAAAGEEGPALAVVVPAFRGRFLGQALESMAAQTCRHFTVYVGDDASPDDLRAIVAPFLNRLTVHYTRFETNLGGQDLVAQWRRCVDLARHEPWIWLFSDDDLMDPQCVQRWRAAVRQAPGQDLFRFGVNQIDENGTVTLVEPDFPPVLRARDFILGKLTGRYRSHAPEFVFSRRAYAQGSVFQAFPLAWCVDDAAWTLMAERGGMVTVAGPRVSWRVSGQNISSGRPELAQRKVEATALFIAWLQEHLRRHPAGPGEPADAVILRAARHWFYSHARGVGYRFGWFPCRSLLQTVAPLQGHGWLGTWLRMRDSDRYAARRARG